MSACANEIVIGPRSHNCSFAPVCPVCRSEQPCPPLIVLAVLDQEAIALVQKPEKVTDATF
jgi:hypothetical protein